MYTSVSDLIDDITNEEENGPPLGPEDEISFRSNSGNNLRRNSTFCKVYWCDLMFCIRMSRVHSFFLVCLSVVCVMVF